MTAREDLLARAVEWFTENGIGDTSLRAIGTALGTSHRMLIYHFGSREGLLTAVVEHVEQRERDLLAGLLETEDDPYEAGMRFWSQVADTAVDVRSVVLRAVGPRDAGTPARIRAP